MVFSSSIFIHFFLPVLLLFYFLAENKYRNYILLIFSLLFYAWGEGRLINILLIMITVNYLLGIGVSKLSGKLKLYLLVIGILANISVLGYYKYILFILENWQLYFGGDAYHSMMEEGIILPLGISFYTFQNISYLVDVYKGEVKAQTNWAKYTLYVSFFAHLMAGPIVRYIDVERDITNRTITWDLFYNGLNRFILGLGKKVLIANQVGQFADLTFDNHLQAPFYIYWLGVVCYALQIYFDFSGYSDMAIGMSRMFGFHFLENFNMPYIARSVTDFWRRWHMSLSTWFRDYVYIPLGGNRKGNARLYFNLSVVFLLTGFWHGASWNFIVWGAIHGCMLILERLFLQEKLSKLPKFIGHFYLLSFILISWVLFRANNLTESITYLNHMFSFEMHGNKEILLNFDNEIKIAFIAGLIVMFGGANKLLEFIESYFGKKTANFSLLTFNIGLLVLCMIYVSLTTYNPFIYYRF